MRRVSRPASILGAAVVLSSCGGDGLQDAARTANDARVGQVGRVADEACRRAADAIPAARKVFDDVRERALRGDASDAKALLDKALALEASGLELKARLALQACRAALG